MSATKFFLGGIRPLPPENQPTGIFKREVEGPVWLGREGLAGDAQADRRVHGGAEKALHQYPVFPCPAGTRAMSASVTFSGWAMP